MGFGSYDESEQQDQEVNADGDDGVSMHEHEHEGEVTFDTESSTDDLINQLKDVKSDAE